MKVMRPSLVDAVQAVGGGFEDARGARFGGQQFGGALLHQFFQVLAVAFELGFRLLALGDVARDALHMGDLAAGISHQRGDHFGGHDATALAVLVQLVCLHKAGRVSGGKGSQPLRQQLHHLRAGLGCQGFRQGLGHHLFNREAAQLAAPRG
jgi:hypothetical protein